jgi:hypothetical protein
VKPRGRPPKPFRDDGTEMRLLPAWEYACVLCGRGGEVVGQPRKAEPCGACGGAVFSHPAERRWVRVEREHMPQLTAERNGSVTDVTDMDAVPHGERKQRASHLEWLRIGDLVPHPSAQRRFVPSHADAIAAHLELEGIGFLVVSIGPDGVPYVIDGQHRLQALKRYGFSPDDTVQCELYKGLTAKEEARLFLERNFRKAVDPISSFRVAVDAGESEAVAIEVCVRNQGLSIGRPSDRALGSDRPAVGAVGTLRTIYRQSGGTGLGKTLRIVRDAYGAAGFEAGLIAGLGLVVHRYPEMDEAVMVKALSETAGGIGGLRAQAAKTKASLNEPRPLCIAATAVAFYNRHAGQKAKLAPWWKE